MSQNTNIDKVSQAIELAIRESGVRAISSLPAFTQAIRMAQGIRAIREALGDEFVQSTLMPLQGTTLGFLTDKDKDGGYGLAVVRDCCIEAMLRGFNVVGNEFNIIAARFYAAKAGLERQVAEFDGLRDLQLQPGVPVLIGDKGALVPYSATWTLQGKAMSLHCQQVKDGLDLRIPVKVNAGMGADAIIGKATRKLLFRIHQRITGSSYGLVDGDVSDEPIVTTGEPAPSPLPDGTPEGKRIKLGGKKGPAAPATAAPAAQASAEPAPQPKPSEAEPPNPASRARVNGRQPAAPAVSNGPSATAPLTWPMVHAALGKADALWEATETLPIIMAWSPEQMEHAYAWAVAFDDKSIADVDLPPRPKYTVLDRQPGED